MKDQKMYILDLIININQNNKNRIVNKNNNKNQYYKWFYQNKIHRIINNNYKINKKTFHLLHREYNKKDLHIFIDLDHLYVIQVINMDTSNTNQCLQSVRSINYIIIN